MPGFDPITLPMLLVLAGLSACPEQGRVDVEVRMQQNDSPYITSSTSQQLTATYGRDPDSTMSTDGHWMVGGVTVVSGDGLRSQVGMEFSKTMNYKTDTACFAVSKIKYEIQYSPKVYIASDFLNQGCSYSVVLMHEKRHVQADVRTITDFIPDMRRKIQSIGDNLKPQGPYPSAAIEEAQQRFLREVHESLRPVWTELVALRRQRQAAIDTEDNYRRETATCPGQFKFNGAP